MNMNIEEHLNYLLGAMMEYEYNKATDVQYEQSGHPQDLVLFHLVKVVLELADREGI